MERPFRKILVIKMQYHGSMLLITLIISTFKQNYPDIKIDMLFYQDTIPILSESPEVNAPYGIGNKDAGTFDRIRNMLSLIKILRANSYGLVINPTDQWVMVLLVCCLPARMKILQPYGHRQHGAWKKSFTYLASVYDMHIAERNLSVPEPLDITSSYTDTTMSYTEDCWKKMHRELDALGMKGHYVVIRLTAHQISKCWNNGKFSKVVDTLQQQGYQVALTYGLSTDDFACVDEITRGCETRPIIGLAGKTRFPEPGALIDHIVLFIDVDSVPGHTTTAVKTPVISLFDATDHVFWRSWTENIIQFWAGNCQEMSTWHEFDHNKKYLSIIPAEDVIAATEELLPEDTPLTDRNVQL